MVKEDKALVLSIFCNYKSTVEQTVDNVLCSLLKQRVQNYGLFPLTKKLYDDRNVKDPSNADLIKCLSEALQCVSSHVYIVLDALDEFDNDYQANLIHVIRELLGNNIHLLVLSRPDIALESCFKADTTLDIEASADDIKLYITNRISQSQSLTSFVKKREGTIMQEEILDTVTEKSYCMCVTHISILLYLLTNYL